MPTHKQNRVPKTELAPVSISREKRKLFSLLLKKNGISEPLSAQLKTAMAWKNSIVCNGSAGEEASSLKLSKVWHSECHCNNHPDPKCKFRMSPR